MNNDKERQKLCESFTLLQYESDLTLVSGKEKNGNKDVKFYQWNLIDGIAKTAKFT